VKLIFSFLLIALSLLTNVQASVNQDLEEGLEMERRPVFPAPILDPSNVGAVSDTTEPFSASPPIIPMPSLSVVIPDPESPVTPVPATKWQHFSAWAGHITGNILTIIGIPFAATGGVLVASYPDISSFEGQLGIGLAGLGAIMDRSGNLLLENSRREAAELEKTLNKHVRKASRSVELSPEALEDLSSEFFATSEIYKNYMGCASKANRLIGRFFKVVGPAAILTGGGFTLMNQKPIGPILTVTGAAISTIGDALKKRADAHDAQLKRICEINKVREKISSSKSII
jgi:hypothetical protein